MTSSPDPANSHYVTSYVGRGDLPPELADVYDRSGCLAWDVETTGLDWRHDRLATCQVFAPDVGSCVISMSGEKPVRLLRLLENPAVEKIFHHAPFDLRFMVRSWDARPASVRCTKVASKLLQPDAPNDVHSLQRLTWRYLGVRLDKGPVRTSDWSAQRLSRDQVAYAIGDVLHLLSLYETMARALAAEGLRELYDDCCAFLPAHARLETGGYPDVFAY